MTDTQVVVVSLAIGLAVGIALLMVIWACRACLGKPKTADDDNTARDAAGRRQPAAEPAAAPAQQVNVELPVGLERAHHDPSVRAIVFGSCHRKCLLHFAQHLITSLILTRKM